MYIVVYESKKTGKIIFKNHVSFTEKHTTVIETDMHTLCNYYTIYIIIPEVIIELLLKLIKHTGCCFYLFFYINT